ncbi:MAG: hypothetical protein ABII18_00520 [bacterium]|nr:hypothetical protein [bacterium]MBU1917082.1 hypothetical protein [bacterium]
MIKGWEHFKIHFRQFSKDFILVGGVASHLQLEEIGAPKVRPTKDLDIVLMMRPSHDFLNHLKKYIKDGGYEIQKGDDEHAWFYRFQNPKHNDYPEMIELFASANKDLNLFEEQHIIPVTTPTGIISLSAILLDDDYFELIKNNAVENDGIYLLSPLALIPFKAKAYLEIKERKEDSKKWKKHRSDIINLTVSFLNKDNKALLTGQVREHFKEFITQLNKEMTDDIIKGACQEKITKDEVITLLEEVFLKD